MLDDTGFSFVKCKVTGSGALYLGRAWGPFSRVVFAYTYMDNIILPTGWYNWGDPNREMYVFFLLFFFFFSSISKNNSNQKLKLMDKILEYVIYSNTLPHTRAH